MTEWLNAPFSVQYHSDPAALLFVLQIHRPELSDIRRVFE